MNLRLPGTILVLIMIFIIMYTGYFSLKAGTSSHVATSPAAYQNRSDASEEESGWIYPHSANDKMLWGITNGIIWGIPGSAMDYNPGGAWAEGLLRIGWTDASGSSHFFNYLGITILSGSKKYDASESEKIRFFPDSRTFHENLEKLVKEKGETSGEVQNYLDPVKNPPAPVSQATTVSENSMSVLFRLSEFRNSGSRIYLILEIDRKNPKEIKISSYNPLQETNQLEYIGLSSTYGNLGRLRNLYLKDTVVHAKDLFRSEGPGIGCFYPYHAFRVNELPVDANGVIVYAGNDEEGSWTGDLGSNAPYYGGEKFFQYWRKYAGSYRDDLSVRVNGRENYFGGFINPCGGKKITGGISFENFEMNERYYPGQTFWFGYAFEKNGTGIVPATDR
jgi:hypothetical protein